MRHAKSSIKKFLEIIILTLFITPNNIFAAETERKPQSSKTDFVLTVKDNLISLKAKDASLKEVLEEIGRRMKIDVIGSLPENEKVAVEFEKLSLEQAVQRLSANYSFQIDSEKGGKRITKLIVLDKGKDNIERRVLSDQKPAKPKEETAAKQPEPFKFVIGDPEPAKKGR